MRVLFYIRGKEIHDIGFCARLIQGSLNYGMKVYPKDKIINGKQAIEVRAKGAKKNIEQFINVLEREGLMIEEERKMRELSPEIASDFGVERINGYKSRIDFNRVERALTFGEMSKFVVIGKKIEGHLEKLPERLAKAIKEMK